MSSFDTQTLYIQKDSKHTNVVERGKNIFICLILVLFVTHDHPVFFFVQMLQQQFLFFSCSFQLSYTQRNTITVESVIVVVLFSEQFSYFHTHMRILVKPLSFSYSLKKSSLWVVCVCVWLSNHMWNKFFLLCVLFCLCSTKYINAAPFPFYSFFHPFFFFLPSLFCLCGNVSKRI